MDDGIDAAARRIKGSIKEAIGMMIGDPAIEAEGAAEKKADGEENPDTPRSSDPEKS